jgi:hypothetical protein
MTYGREKRDTKKAVRERDNYRSRKRTILIMYNIVMFEILWRERYLDRNII